MPGSLGNKVQVMFYVLINTVVPRGILSRGNIPS
jgi:hypothetical protein